MMLANSYPRPDVVLTNDQPCEGLQKTIFTAGKWYEAPVYTLHTPNDLDEDALDYLEDQIDTMMENICKAVGVEYDPQMLAQAVRYSNEAKEYYSKACDLLKTHRLPGLCRELQEIFGMNVFGSRENVDLCKTVYEDAQGLAKSGASKRRRVLWIGQTPSESEDLVRHLEKSVEIIYWSSLWDANFVMLDEERPARSIAERSVRYHWNSDRIEADVDRICKAYDIDALLIGVTWGCRNALGVSPALRALAEKKKLKHLTINIDPVDRNNYSFTHIKNRVDAFLETLLF